MAKTTYSISNTTENGPDTVQYTVCKKGEQEIKAETADRNDINNITLCTNGDQKRYQRA